MMKNILVIAFMIALGFSGSYAAGTAAGTTITNSYSLAYTVGGISQTPQTGNDGGFLVDNKNDVLVTTNDVASIKVTPSSTSRVLTFTVKNEGNKVQDFILSASQAAVNTAPFGLTDAFNATNLNAYVESGATAGYQVGEDTATYIDELAADGEKIVYVVADIPGSAANGDAAIVSLVAQLATGGTASSLGSATVNDTGADVAGTEQIVWADGSGALTTDVASDGMHSSASAYEVQSASLTVTKSSCVIWDPVNTTTNPKRIPGAVVRYTIQVANAAGAQDATSVSASDTLPLTVSYGVGSSGLTPVAQVGDGACNCTTPGSANGGSVVESSGIVTATYDGAISASETQCAYFDVTIQ